MYTSHIKLDHELVAARIQKSAPLTLLFSVHTSWRNARKYTGFKARPEDSCRTKRGEPENSLILWEEKIIPEQLIS